MFGGMAFKASMLAKKSTGGGGGDVTPDAVNWTIVRYNATIGNFLYTEKQITGIDTSITLLTSYDDSNYTLYYLVSNTDQGLDGSDISQDPSFLGFSAVAGGGTFSVSNNQYVAFAVVPSVGIDFTEEVAIYNQSDSNALLDKFNTEQTGT